MHYMPLVAEFMFGVADANNYFAIAGCFVQLGVRVLSAGIDIGFGIEV